MKSNSFGKIIMQKHIEDTHFKEEMFSILCDARMINTVNHHSF